MPPLSLPMRRLCEWVADYYLAPLASVVRMVWPSVAFLGEREVTEYRLGDTLPARMTPERRTAVDKLAGQQGLVRDLARIAACRMQCCAVWSRPGRWSRCAWGQTGFWRCQIRISRRRCWRQHRLQRRERLPMQ
jgi:primosomal protein N'